MYVSSSVSVVGISGSEWACVVAPPPPASRPTAADAARKASTHAVSRATDPSNDADCYCMLWWQLSGQSTECATDALQHSLPFKSDGYQKRSLQQTSNGESRIAPPLPPTPPSCSPAHVHCPHHVPCSLPNQQLLKATRYTLPSFSLLDFHSSYLLCSRSAPLAPTSSLPARCANL
jgi:hypothetical protein